MNEIKKLQGVPTQIEYLKPKGGRRHIAWCKYSEHKGNRRYICKNPESPYSEIECHSCKQCDYYEDKRTL